MLEKTQRVHTSATIAHRTVQWEYHHGQFCHHVHWYLPFNALGLGDMASAERE